jgi:hypothetical protein
MFSLILAASLAAAQPTHLPVYPLQQPPNEQVERISNLCLAVLGQKATPQQIVDGLQLDTKEKQQGFVNLCSMYFKGIVDGVKADQEQVPEGTVQPKPPEASSN